MNKLKISKALGLTGVSVCVLCCALPLIGLSAGMAAFAVTAFYLEKIGIVLIGGAIVFFLYNKLSNNKPSPSCSPNCGCKGESQSSKS